MKLPKELVTVTPFSKTLALLMFTTLPILAFIFGMSYQRAIIDKANNEPVQGSCTEEARICPDGSTVGRVGPNCEFTACPTAVSQEEKINCSGIRGLICPTGYVCDMGGKVYPDASGICIRVPENRSNYKCPKTEYVDCMPGSYMMKAECTKQFLQWAEANCPDFKGAAF